MRITNVRIHPVTDSPRLKAYATVVFDRALAINEIRIIQAHRGLCLEFPKIICRKGRNLKPLSR